MSEVDYLGCYINNASAALDLLSYKIPLDRAITYGLRDGIEFCNIVEMGLNYDKEGFKGIDFEIVSYMRKVAEDKPTLVENFKKHSWARENLEKILKQEPEAIGQIESLRDYFYSFLDLK